MGTVDFDSGVSIRDMIKALAKYGVCLESLWPYIIADFKLKPNPDCYQEAEKRKIKEYLRLDSVSKNKLLYNLKHSLYCGNVIVFGLKLYTSFRNTITEKEGIVLEPKLFEKSIGGHAMMIVGYIEELQVFIVRNSWGEEWGDKGYCYIPYNYILKKGHDFWTIK